MSRLEKNSRIQQSALSIIVVSRSKSAVDMPLQEFSLPLLPQSPGTEAHWNDEEEDCKGDMAEGFVATYGDDSECSSRISIPSGMLIRGSSAGGSGSEAQLTDQFAVKTPKAPELNPSPSPVLSA